MLHHVFYLVDLPVMLEALCESITGKQFVEVGKLAALGQVFAADGNGHISYCPQHGELTFAWACG